MERERRSHEEQQRWIREEAARVAKIKEEAIRLQKEREETERRERERREKERRDEELRMKREQRDRERQERERDRDQKRERDEMEKRMQSGSGRLGKRPYQQQQQQDNGSFESKRPAYSSPSSYSALSNNNSSIFNRLEPHKANRSGPSQPDGGGGGVPTAPMIQAQDLPHVNPEIISAASQALANIRKTVPTVPSHMSSGRGGGSSLQAQIQQLAAATALASASSRPNMGMEFRGSSGTSNSPSQSYSSDMMRPSMGGRSQGGVGRGMGMMSKSPHLGGGGSSMGGGGSGGLGKLPPEDQRYNRRLGGGSRSGGGMGGPGSYRSHGRQGRGY